MKRHTQPPIRAAPAMGGALKKCVLPSNAKIKRKG